MSRHCARPGCNQNSVATLAYDYAARTVWIDDVAPESHPATYDLCLRHATNLRVPLGWQLRDRRATRAEAVRLPGIAHAS